MEKYRGGIAMEKQLYKLSRKIGKAATMVNDVKTLASGDPKRIAKRLTNKQTYKASHGGANKLARKITENLWK